VRRARRQAPAPARPKPPDPRLLALVEEACKKSGLVWLDCPELGRPRAAWHVWHEGAVAVIHGGPEQALAGLDRARRVVVHTRSKDTGALLVTWVAAGSTIPPGSPQWDQAAAALAGERLNARDAVTLLDTWAAAATLTRLEPTGEVLEQPGAYRPASRAAPPPPTPATTRGRLPRVLHRRQRRAPKL
jgi:hypothetical protein